MKTAVDNPHQIIPVIADIYMEYFKDMAIETSKYKPSLWLRYVDDTFVIWKHGKVRLDEFLSHLNSCRDSISFTMDFEVDGSTPFLDVRVTRKGNRLQTSVYRKPAHTDRYLNFTSNHANHHPRIKSGIVRCLAHRARKVCDKDSIDNEMIHLQRVFTTNNYPSTVVTKCFPNLEMQTTLNRRNNQQC